MTHDAEQLASFLAEYSKRAGGGDEAPGVKLQSLVDSAHPHLLVDVESLQRALIDTSPEVSIPLDDTHTLTVQKLPGGGQVKLELKF